MTAEARQPAEVHRVPSGGGLAVPLPAGAIAEVVNTHGTQVVDLWAFPGEPGEHLSMEHSRELRKRIWFAVGDQIVSNRYRPLLTLVADSSPGRHDTLIAACSAEMYTVLAGDSEHPSCAANLRAALVSSGRGDVVYVPQPWNLFMRAPVDADGVISYMPPDARPGDHVALRAETDVLLVLSACPDDVYPTNGGDGRPRDAALRVLTR